MTKVTFKIDELKAGDVITMPRYGSEGLNEEVQRWLIVGDSLTLVDVIVLLDASNRYGWLGKLMTFAKSEIDTDRWRLLC
jgi:hypothetical protein